jgi:uncharacterized membrane protein
MTLTRSSIVTTALTAAIAIVVALGLLSAPAAAAPAPADHNPYTPKEICGPRFYVVKDKGGIGGKAKRPVKYSDSSIWGYVYLMYNDTTGKNCVATRKIDYVGKETYMFAGLQVKGSGWKQENGPFGYFAGPVKKKAAGKCVRYHGSIEDTRGNRASGGRYTWGNCG